MFFQFEKMSGLNISFASSKQFILDNLDFYFGLNFEQHIHSDIRNFRHMCNLEKDIEQVRHLSFLYNVFGPSKAMERFFYDCLPVLNASKVMESEKLDQQTADNIIKMMLEHMKFQTISAGLKKHNRKDNRFNNEFHSVKLIENSRR